MFEYDDSQVGSLFIGTKVYENTKLKEGLKMFENVTVTPTNTSATAVLPNTNSSSLRVNRGGV